MDETVTGLFIPPLLYCLSMEGILVLLASENELGGRLAIGTEIISILVGVSEGPEPAN